jgi:hypothetical protein
MRQTDDIKVWFPIKQGFLRKTVDHVKAVDGCRSPCAPDRRWAWSVNPARARRRWAWR